MEEGKTFVPMIIKRRGCNIKMKKICSRCKKKEPTTTSCRYCDLCREVISKEYYIRQKEYSRERSVYIHKKYKEDPFIGIRNRLMSKVAMKKIYHANRNHQVASRLRNCLRSALRKYTKDGKITSSKKYGIDYKKIIKKLEPFPTDLSKYHIDHIVPLSSFNLENKSEIKKAFAPENHQWLLAEDNISKRDKLDWNNNTDLLLKKEDINLNSNDKLL